jgi:hypothetical protein
MKLEIKTYFNQVRPFRDKFTPEMNETEKQFIRLYDIYKAKGKLTEISWESVSIFFSKVEKFISTLPEFETMPQTFEPPKKALPLMCQRPKKKLARKVLTPKKALLKRRKSLLIALDRWLNSTGKN